MTEQSLKATVQSDLTTAIRARDAVRSGTLRMALAAITNEEVAGKESRELTDDDVLKVLAKELNIPVLLLSQLSRACESRDNKRPRLSDLRDSGQIEQDADVVVFLYREEVYDDLEAYAGKAELIVGKQRNGPVGSVPLTFIDRYARFENAAKEAR